jgi:DNA-binding response OmpR family regulator
MASVTVLVVDDEQALRDFVRRNLEDRGYTIVSAADGAEALAIFNALPLDLVVLDVRMPRLDGLEATRRIRQQSETPIIVLTAPGEESDKIHLFDLGADDCLNLTA